MFKCEDSVLLKERCQKGSVRFGEGDSTTKRHGLFFYTVLFSWQGAIVQSRFLITTWQATGETKAYHHVFWDPWIYSMYFSWHFFNFSCIHLHFLKTPPTSLSTRPSSFVSHLIGCSCKSERRKVRSRTGAAAKKWQFNWSKCRVMKNNLNDSPNLSFLLALPAVGLPTQQCYS